MKAWGYARVSTDEQAHGISLDAQRDKIQSYMTLHDHHLVGIPSDDGISGKSMANRPALLEVLDAVCEAKGLLVVWKIDRLGRSTRDLIDIADRLKKAGAQFASITEHIDTTTASGRMFFKLMAVFAEFERESIVERTKAAVARKRDRHEVIGGIPYGFQRQDDRLIVEPGEHATLEMILEAAEDGCSYAEIARTLEAEGRLSRSGRRWDRGVVRRIVKFHRTKDGAHLRTLARPTSA